MPDTVTSPLVNRRQVAQRLARAVTEVLAPAHLVVGVLLAVGLASSPTLLAGLGWGLLAALFAGIIPYGIIIGGTKLGYLTDRHVGERAQRAVPLLAGIVSVLAGIAGLVALGAPQPLLALVGAMFVGLGTTLAVTLVWKISVHTAVAGGTVVILTLVFGPALAAIAPIVALTGWSRVKLGDHTATQTIAGAALGAAVATMVFTALS